MNFNGCKNVCSLTTLAFTGMLVFTANASEEQEFEAFLKQQEAEFAQYEKKHNKAFEDFVVAWREAEESYKAKINKKWSKPNLPTSKVWVSYSEDLNNRTSIDFANGNVTVEVLGSASDEEAIKFAKDRVKELSQVTVKSELMKDPIYVTVTNALSSQKKLLNKTNRSFDENKTPIEISQRKVERIAEQTILPKKLVNKTISQIPVVSRDRNDKIQISFALPDNTLSIQAKKYLPEVEKQAARWNIDPALLLAIIHTESSFNPLARSPVPAFGLMQIVPGSAGLDVSNFLQGKPLMLSPEYLFQADNNVEAGSTYFHILSNRYFKHVHNEQSRFYMSIAAYNTGPGNVSKTLSGVSSLNQASIAANSMTPSKVYSLMLNRLPAQETRDYLQKVVKRTAYYQEQIKGI